MKNKFLILGITGLLAACQIEPSQNKSGDKLLWSDEFEIAGLPDSTKWGYHTGGHGWGNNELQHYLAARTENARVENGKLIIEAHREEVEDKEYSSARLISQPSGKWQYAYVEVKAKLPKGRGTWPAIWMMPDASTYGGWPKSGEIDIMEHVGYDPGVIHGTVHTESFNHVDGTHLSAQKTITDFDEEFHVYAINWTEEEMEFFIDGEKYFSFVNTGNGSDDWPFDQDFYLILNVAVGGNWAGKEGVDESIWPQRMEVDYVRVYEPRPLTPTKAVEATF